MVVKHKTGFTYHHSHGVSFHVPVPESVRKHTQYFGWDENLYTTKKPQVTRTHTQARTRQHHVSGNKDATSAARGGQPSHGCPALYKH